MRNLLRTLFLITLVLSLAGCTPDSESPTTTDTAAESEGVNTEVGREAAEEDLAACESNLKNIGTAMEMYSTDWGGKYPPLDAGGLAMLTPNYLKTIPVCPAADTVTYQYLDETFELNSEGYLDYYYLSCEGENHSEAGISDNFPAYDPLVGIIGNQDSYDDQLKGRQQQQNP